MKVHLFEVTRSDASAPLIDVLRRIEAGRIDDRLRTIGTNEVRVEQIRRDGHQWFLDFGRLRYLHGPGRAHRGRAIRGFDFDDGEGFGEETAALYDDRSNFMAIQYNHDGVRSGTIQSYLSNYIEAEANSYELAFKLDREAERRLQNKTFFSSVTVAIAVGRMGEDDRRAGAPLSEVIGLGREAGARRVEIHLSMGQGRHNGLDRRQVGRLLNWVRGTIRHDPESVSRATVVGKENPDAEAEAIDLVHQRLVQNFEDLRVGPDLRYAREDRWQALRRAFRGWARVIAEHR